MQRVPDSWTNGLSGEISRWIAFERDAAWAAKLAILRLARCDDIERFGACLREHDRHADELGQLLRATDRASEAPSEPCFVSRDAHAIGAAEDAGDVLDAMRALETERIRRYETRPARVDDEPHRLLDALLERHAVDARSRLTWLEDRRRSRRAAA
jgi:hypothetical protein